MNAIKLKLSALSVTLDMKIFSSVADNYNNLENDCLDIKNITDLYNIKKIVISGSSISYNSIKQIVSKSKGTFISIDLEGAVEESLYSLEVNQYRYCDFLENFILNSNLANLERFKGLKSKYKVIVIYVCKNSFNYIDRLNGVVSSIIKKGYMISIIVLPYYFLKEGQRLSLKENKIVSGIVDDLIENHKDRVYGDFPVMGCEFDNLKGLCPKNLFMLNVFANGDVNPCKFSNIKLGHISEDINKIWEYWNNLDKCDVNCINYSLCGGGCFGNKRRIQDRDFYCVYNN